MHALVNGRLLPEEAVRLRDKLAFIYSIDPQFVERLCSKNAFASWIPSMSRGNFKLR